MLNNTFFKENINCYIDNMDMLSMLSKIRVLLIEKNIKHKEFAHTIGISPGRLSNFLRGQNKIPNDILGKIADNLNVSVDYLLGRTPERIYNDPKPTYINEPNEALAERRKQILTDRQRKIIALLLSTDDNIREELEEMFTKMLELCAIEKK